MHPARRFMSKLVLTPWGSLCMGVLCTQLRMRLRDVRASWAAMPHAVTRSHLSSHCHSGRTAVDIPWGVLAPLSHHALHTLRAV
jgi:hypothetical protein